ncbi:unnamed protein product, partial [Rotaria sp. Silwood2]
MQKCREEHIDAYETTLRVFRGKRTSIKELRQIQASEGKHVITAGFLSTSIYRRVASHFAIGEDRAGNEIIIIYYLIIDPSKSMMKPTALISHKSRIQWECEVLIPIGTIFRVESIKHTD